MMLIQFYSCQLSESDSCARDPQQQCIVYLGSSQKRGEVSALVSLEHLAKDVL
jgi:hypothetical protein